jgi:ATP-dependent DNA helicase PIF1
MYVGGVGGTGKSHLIKAVVELFTRLGRRRELQLSAPTGAAAVVIEGATIHSLALLPNRKNVKVEALSLIWRDITFLVLDEISMLDASLLAEVSDRISLGKRGEHSSNDTPFGGINVLFTGDFGQLKPVAGSSLFSNRLVNRLSASTAASVNGQQDLLGVMIWRQVTDVVLLCKNQRQADDPDYAALLDRVRSGTCISRILPGGSATDVSILNARILSSMEKSDPHIHATFEDAPVIVGLKDLRDEVNRQRVLEVAQRLGVPVHNYYSQDTRLKQPLEPRFQQLAWGTSSRWTRDALGILPLFHGMKVMITDNLALDNKLVNGADGIVQETDYGIDDAGRRYAKVCYVLVEGSKVQIPGHAYEVVPILPVTSNFKYTLPIPPNFTSRSRSLGPKTISISRSQLPLVPAYSYTHYKSQGRTLTRAVVDLETSASLQGAYVMLSRVKSLQGIAIFRPFKPTRIQQNLSEEQRNEFKRLQQLDEQTKLLYARITEPEDDDLFMT